MQLHPCTETDVKSFKIMFLNPKNLQKKNMLQASNVWKLAIFLQIKSFWWPFWIFELLVVSNVIIRKNG